MSRSAVDPKYLIPVFSKALDVLEVFQRHDRPVSLETLQQQTKIPKTTLYRILKTLVHRGYVAQSSNGLYRIVTKPRKLRFGFGQQCAGMPFSDAVTASLLQAATRAGVELLIRDNRYDPASAVAVAEEFVSRRVDLLIEFQIDQDAAPVIADKISSAGIPLIAVDVPHPNAIYFGVDNYRVGFEAGELLAGHVAEVWKGRVDRVLGLDIQHAGPIVQSRITGSFRAIQHWLPDLPFSSYIRIDGAGVREKSAQAVADFLLRHPQDRRILISAANDTSALGALSAARELRRETNLAIAGQDCIPEAVEEMSRAGSPWLGSVSHEASSYGEALIQLGLSMLQGATVAPYNYIEHRLITAEALRSRPSGAESNGSMRGPVWEHA